MKTNLTKYDEVEELVTVGRNKVEDKRWRWTGVNLRNIVPRL